MVRTHGLSHISIAVEDLERAAAFYRELLGAIEICKIELWWEP